MRYLKLGDEVVIFGNVFGIVEGNDHPTSYAILIRSLQKIIENYVYNTRFFKILIIGIKGSKSPYFEELFSPHLDHKFLACHDIIAGI